MKKILSGIFIIVMMVIGAFLFTDFYSMMKSGISENYRIRNMQGEYSLTQIESSSATIMIHTPPTSTYWEFTNKLKTRGADWINVGRITFLKEQHLNTNAPVRIAIVKESDFFDDSYYVQIDIKTDSELEEYFTAEKIKVYPENIDEVFEAIHLGVEEYNIKVDETNGATTENVTSMIGNKLPYNDILETTE